MSLTARKTAGAVLTTGALLAAGWLLARHGTLVAPLAAPAPPRAPVRLTAVQAEELVETYIRAQTPGMSADARFPVKELTTDPVWKRLGAQVFQVTGGVRACETFVLKDKKVHHIGLGLGGSGVTSLCVADLNGDGRPELVFAFSWGSGIHRLHVAVFDLLAKEPRAFAVPQTYFGLPDMAVRRVDDKTVYVEVGKHTVGRLALEGKGEKAKATLRLSKDLPAEIKKHLRE